jgi:hypothetical protein
MNRFFIIALIAQTGSHFVSANEIDFNQDVRPILSDKCFACHGPDEHDRKADLRLDTFEGATHDNDGTTAIVPGDIKASEAWARIITDDEDEAMPPPKHNKHLTKREKDILKQWILEGAEYKPHWAYTPVTRPEDAPDDTSAAIDHFVKHAQSEAGFKASPPTDPATLVRRLSIDLLGLAPSPEVVKTFSQEYSKDPQAAIRKQVDTYLANPAYGERMAVYWLDLARYADTIGYHSDNTRTVSPYRDYVIEAFNKNLPYDQFVREQLAGDLLPNATINQRVASTYNRLLQTTQEGGAQAREYEKIHAADRVRNTSLLFLGSTIGCAQCHDHKFDPFTAHDFYAFAAFFDDIKEKPKGPRKTVLKVPNVAQQKELAALEKNRAIPFSTVVKNDPALGAKIAAGQQKWESDPQPNASSVEAQTPMLVKTVKTSGSPHEIQADGTVKLLLGKNPEKENITVTAPAPMGHYTGLILHALTDSSFPKGGLTVGGNGNFVLTNLKVFHKGRNVRVSGADADYSQPKFPVSDALNGNTAEGWAVNGDKENKPHSALFTFRTPLKAAADDEIKVILEHQTEQGHHVISKFKLTLTSAPSPLFAREVGPTQEIATLLAKTPRSEEEQDKIDSYYHAFAPALEAHRQQLIAWQNQQKAIDVKVRRTLASEALPAEEMRITTLLNRGDWMDKTGAVIQPAVPVFLNQIGSNQSSEAKKQATPAERLNRLDLAKWITDPENPLTARTYVNRIWMLLFGRGIASDVSDLGGQGTPPDHPELLDLLASEFIASGWDTKHLVRTILSSQTYQQSSKTNAESLAADPDNVHLSRQGRWRIDGEFVRDIALQHAGLLVHQEGGESVKPLQPAGYWAQLNFPKRTWKASDNLPDRYRRGLYTFWCRSFLHPAMIAFDAPTREECTPQRTRSNIPQQALVLLNEPSFVEAAKALAQRTITEGGSSDEQRINWLFSELLSRAPLAEESKILTGLLSQKRSQDKPDTLSTWSVVTRVLLNTYETTSRF